MRDTFKHTEVANDPISYTEFESIMRDAGWNADEIEYTWARSTPSYRACLVDAVIADGERDLSASIEDYQ